MVRLSVRGLRGKLGRLPDNSCFFRYFNRDVDCIRTFFKRRFRYESALYPRFNSAINEQGEAEFRLDIVVAASGFKNKDQQALEEVRSLVFFSLGCCTDSGP